mmetsp:Transcript_18527/g.39656  ORF Transcript_18527/g.39656 Transcript_18527/m.39656 type:complete len:256 (+) Transcript_18527:717-1484(+)
MLAAGEEEISGLDVSVVNAVLLVGGMLRVSSNKPARSSRIRAAVGVVVDVLVGGGLTLIVGPSLLLALVKVHLVVLATEAIVAIEALQSHRSSMGHVRDVRPPGDGVRAIVQVPLAERYTDQSQRTEAEDEAADGDGRCDETDLGDLGSKGLPRAHLCGFAVLEDADAGPDEDGQGPGPAAAGAEASGSVGGPPPLRHFLVLAAALHGRSRQERGIHGLHARLVHGDVHRGNRVAPHSEGQLAPWWYCLRRNDGH